MCAYWMMNDGRRPSPAGVWDFLYGRECSSSFKIYKRLNVAKRTRINHNVLAVPCIFLDTRWCDQVDSSTNGLKESVCTHRRRISIFIFLASFSLEKKKEKWWWPPTCFPWLLLKTNQKQTHGVNNNKRDGTSFNINKKVFRVSLARWR